MPKWLTNIFHIGDLHTVGFYSDPPVGALVSTPGIQALRPTSKGTDTSQKKEQIYMNEDAETAVKGSHGSCFAAPDNPFFLMSKPTKYCVIVFYSIF